MMLRSASFAASRGIRSRGGSLVASAARPIAAHQAPALAPVQSRGLKSSVVLREGFFERLSNSLQSRAESKQEAGRQEMEKDLITLMKDSDSFPLSVYREVIKNSVKKNEQGVAYWINRIPGVKQQTGQAQTDAMLSIFDVMTSKELSGEAELGPAEVERVATSAGVELQAVQELVNTHRAMSEVHRYIKHRQNTNQYIPEDFQSIIKYMRVDREAGAPQRPPLWRVAMLKKQFDERNSFRDQYGRKRRQKKF